MERPQGKEIILLSCAYTYACLTSVMLIPRVRGHSVYAEKVLLLLQPPIQVFGIEGRYAHAMYSAAAKHKNLEQVESELSKVDELIRTNDKLSEYLANPTLDKYKKQCESIEVKWKAQWPS